MAPIGQVHPSPREAPARPRGASPQQASTASLPGAGITRFTALSSRTPWVAFGALAVGIFCISWSAIFVRWAVGVSGPASAFYRALIGTVVLLPIWAARRGAARPSRATLGYAALGGLFFALDVACYNTAILKTSAGIATLLANTTPFFVGFGVWILFHNRPRPTFWIGLAVAAVGSTLILHTDLPAHPRVGAGDLIAVAAGFWFAAYLVTTQLARADVDTLTLSTLSIAASAAMLLVLCAVIRTPLSGYPPASWASLLALGLISQVAGYLALTYALGHLPATLTSVALLLLPPITTLLAIPLLGERPSPPQIAGGVIVLLGVLIVTRGA
jgi:drug/metabolite transporter (DMT)-like permease